MWVCDIRELLIETLTIFLIHPFLQLSQAKAVLESSDATLFASLTSVNASLTEKVRWPSIPYSFWVWFWVRDRAQSCGDSTNYVYYVRLLTERYNLTEKTLTISIFRYVTSWLTRLFVTENQYKCCMDEKCVFLISIDWAILRQGPSFFSLLHSRF